MKFNSSWGPFLCGLISHSQISVPLSALVRCLLSTQSSVARVHTATSLSMNVTRLSLLNARKKNILPQVSSSITRLHFKASLLLFFFFFQQSFPWFASQLLNRLHLSALLGFLFFQHVYISKCRGVSEVESLAAMSFTVRDCASRPTGLLCSITIPLKTPLSSGSRRP